MRLRSVYCLSVASQRQFSALALIGDGSDGCFHSCGLKSCRLVLCEGRSETLFCAPRSMVLHGCISSRSTKVLLLKGIPSSRGTSRLRSSWRFGSSLSGLSVVRRNTNEYGLFKMVILTMSVAAFGLRYSWQTPFLKLGGIGIPILGLVSVDRCIRIFQWASSKTLASSFDLVSLMRVMFAHSDMRILHDPCIRRSLGGAINIAPWSLCVKRGIFLFMAVAIDLIGLFSVSARSSCRS